MGDVIQLPLRRAILAEKIAATTARYLHGSTGHSCAVVVWGEDGAPQLAAQGWEDVAELADALDGVVAAIRSMTGGDGAA